MMPFAPTRLSTTTCWPQSSPSFCAGMRASVSTALPAESGTMRRTGLSGYVCAAACSVATRRIKSTAMRIAIPDDYQDIVHRLRCYELLRGHDVIRFKEPARTLDELAERLRGAQVVVAIRERVAFPRALLERLAPQLELFSQSDVLSLHLRLNAETRGAVTAEDLARMKPTALFVNTARAELVQPGALLGALKHGRPGFAALDVYEEEPLPREHPLLQLPNVLCTPHAGWAEFETFETYFGEAFENVARYARGEL